MSYKIQITTQNPVQLSRSQTLVCQVSYILLLVRSFYQLCTIFIRPLTDTLGYQSAMLPPVLFDTFSAVSVSVLSFIVITQPSHPPVSAKIHSTNLKILVLNANSSLTFSTNPNSIFWTIFLNFFKTFGIATLLCKYIFIGAFQSFLLLPHLHSPQLLVQGVGLWLGVQGPRLLLEQKSMGQFPSCHFTSSSATAASQGESIGAWKARPQSMLSLTKQTEVKIRCCLINSG